MFRADLAVAIDDVMEPTLDALLVMESQIHEGGANGDASLYPADESKFSVLGLKRFSWGNGAWCRRAHSTPETMRAFPKKGRPALKRIESY